MYGPVSALPATLPEGAWLLHTASGALHLIVYVPDQVCGAMRIGGPPVGGRRGWRMLRDVAALGEPTSPARVGERARITSSGTEWYDTARLVRIDHVTGYSNPSEIDALAEGIVLGRGRSDAPATIRGHWEEVGRASVQESVQDVLDEQRHERLPPE